MTESKGKREMPPIGAITLWMIGWFLVALASNLLVALGVLLMISAVYLVID